MIISVYVFIALIYFVSMINVYQRIPELYYQRVVGYAGYPNPELIFWIVLMIESLGWPVMMIKNGSRN